MLLTGFQKSCFCSANKVAHGARRASIANPSRTKTIFPYSECFIMQGYKISSLSIINLDELSWPQYATKTAMGK
jgi:hypothetical protein